jgi:hypothetical protein
VICTFCHSNGHELDAIMQCTIEMHGKGFLPSEYDIVHVGPHPDEISLPTMFKPIEVSR